MSIAAPLQTISVGVLVERTKGVTQWSEFAWRAVSVLAGAPETPPWTKLSDDGARATYYAGTAEVELYRTETTYYRNNLESGTPALWVALRAADGEPPYSIATVTADPAEGESLTETATDMVEQVPMPKAIQQILAAFIAEHHVEQTFTKRKRDRADPEALARRGPTGEDQS
ncbi:MAG TPA: DUF3305 domain-containing protein [Pseudolabrys sp.]